MKIKTTVILILTCVIAAYIYFFTQKNNKAKQALFQQGSKLFNDFPVNEITKFTISDATNSITLLKKNEIWVVDNYYDYPADFDKVVSLLKKIYNLKIGQTIRVRKNSLGKLKLIDPANPNGALVAKGIMLQFFQDDGLSAARLLVGKVKQGKANNDMFRYTPSLGQYVFIPNEELTELQDSKDRDNVIIINDAFNLVLSPESWIKKNLFDVKSDKIKEIEISSADGEKYVVARTNKTAKLTLSALGKNEKIKQREIDSLSRALQFFNIEKVVSPDFVSTNKVMEDAWTYTAKTFGGTKYEVKISNTNQPKNYVQINVEYKKTEVESVASNIAENVKVEMEFETPESARELNNMFSGRTYEITDYEAKKLRKARASLVEKKQKSEKKKTEGKAAENNPKAKTENTKK